jgi:tRNA dimethylallyltransferase
MRLAGAVPPTTDPATSGATALPGPIIAIVGPTASGKTALSLDVARALDGEIVNADSMQLYRGMDIGTAKLTPAQWRGVPHHVFDLWEVTEPASVAEYQFEARAAIEGILSRRRTPIMVGGSGLYVRAAVERFEFPGTDPELRARLEAELAAGGPAPLYARLTARDPAAAQKILPSNGRRIVRALEILELTGEAVAASLPESVPYYRTVHIGVDRDPAELDGRVAQRVEQMWAEGFVDEVRGLVQRGLRRGRTARLALGYQQILRLLDGEITEAEAKADTVRATRRFVRRQRSWFRRDRSITWFDAATADLVTAVLDAVRTAVGG